MLEKIEATLVPPRRPRLSITIHEGDDQAAAMENALAELIADVLRAFPSISEAEAIETLQLAGSR
jgi:hypothetical protein